MSGFVKLYGTILTSSIWLEDDATLRVWIAMLATADENGYVGASVGGLAHISRVSRENCVRALEVLSSPDIDSRTEDNEGRRIEKTDGGWFVLNHGKYRDMRTQKQVADAERLRRKREAGEYDSYGPVEEATNATNATCSIVATEAEAETDTTSSTTTTTPAHARIELIMQTLGVPSGNLVAWERLVLGMMQGLGTPGMRPVNGDQLLEAAQEVTAAGGDITPSRFKAFLAKVLARDYEGGAETTSTASRERKGYTLAATELLRRVRRAATEHNPYTGLLGFPANWKDTFNAVELRVIDAITPNRILTDKNEGTLVAQVARVMGEVQA